VPRGAREGGGGGGGAPGADVRASAGLRPGWRSEGPWGKRPLAEAAPAPLQAPAGGLLSAWPKKPRVEFASEEIDTLVVIRPGEAGMTDHALHEYFLQIEGYRALRMGGANCFVKFSSPGVAQAAIQIAAQAGVHVELAKTNMNENQAHYTA